MHPSLARNPHRAHRPAGARDSPHRDEGDSLARSRATVPARLIVKSRWPVDRMAAIRDREQGRDDDERHAVSNSQDEDSRRNDLRRRIAEELIASELRRRQRKRIDAALLDAARESTADAESAEAAAAEGSLDEEPPGEDRPPEDASGEDPPAGPERG